MTPEEIAEQLQKAVEIIESLGFEYILTFTDKKDLSFFSNCSVKDATILFYALSKQSEEFKNVLLSAYYQMQKDKEIGAPMFMGKMAQA